MMHITLTGSIPICVATGILLLSKGRSFGFPIKCSIAQTKPEFGLWEEACLWHEPVLSGLGLPTACHPEVITLGGPSESPLNLNVDGQWIKVTRSNSGQHPLTKCLLSHVSNSPDSAVRVLQDFCSAYSIPKEPAVFDLLFEESLSLATRNHLLIAIQKAFCQTRTVKPPIQSHIVVGNAAVEDEWNAHKIILSEVYRHIDFSLLEQSVDSLEESIKEEVKLRLLRLAEFISLPKVQPNGHSHQPLMSGFIYALGNTSTQHPLNWLSQRFEVLGGKWGDETKDARRLQFRYHNTINGLPELSELSQQARNQCELIWQDIMG
ncbi:MAG: hypothetical protein ACON4U_01615 [Myxococcota bacterium]